LIQVCSGRSWWRVWQAMVQALQPSHVRRSMTMHHACSAPVAAGVAVMPVMLVDMLLDVVDACASSW
jgi:hypothetical protein